MGSLFVQNDLKDCGGDGRGVWRRMSGGLRGPRPITALRAAVVAALDNLAATLIIALPAGSSSSSSSSFGCSVRRSQNPN